MDLAQVGGKAGIEKKALGGGGFARVDMGADADIAVLIDARFTSHGGPWSGESGLACGRRAAPLCKSYARRIRARPIARPEDRRVGKECVSTCRSRGSTSH